MVNVIKDEEYFYGVTLDKKGAAITWDGKGSDEYSMNTDRLHIRQILLGHTAKENEYNVVEVEAMSLRDPVKIPIAVLKVGESRLVQPNLEFPDGPVTFTLVEGNGPVYIHGQHVPGPYNEDTIDEMTAEEFMSEEESGEEEDENEAENAHPVKKQKLSTNNAKNVVANNKKQNSHKKK